MFCDACEPTDPQVEQRHEIREPSPRSRVGVLRLGLQRGSLQGVPRLGLSARLAGDRAADRRAAVGSTLVWPGRHGGRARTAHRATTYGHGWQESRSVLAREHARAHEAEDVHVRVPRRQCGEVGRWIASDSTARVSAP